MTALAFAGGAAVGAPAAYVFLQLLAETRLKFFKGLKNSPEGLEFAHDFLNFTSFLLHKQTNLIEYSQK